MTGQDRDQRGMTSRMEKSLSEAVEQRRATPSFDGSADSGCRSEEDSRGRVEGSERLQPAALAICRGAQPEQRRRLRAASYNQAKVEEASAVIVACGDADGWRNGDLEEMIRLGREGGMTENYAEQAPSTSRTIWATIPT